MEPNPILNLKEENTIFYIGQEGAVTGQFIIGDETLWATQKTMSEIFSVTVPTINNHLNNIFETKELDKPETIRKFQIIQNEGNREVLREVNFYNLDAIISVGYRVNSKEATNFRKWSTEILKEYIVKGFVLDKELLKKGARFQKDYFDELLEQIREIRASERRFYQKLGDIFITSYDYDSKSERAKNFFATIQNKLIYSVTENTAAEIIAKRSDSEKPNMGLTTWNTPHGKILITDAKISKNYLSKKEIRNLNLIVNGVLNLAENRAEREIPTSMKDWEELTTEFIKLNQLHVLTGKGKISSEQAKKIAEKEYSKFRKKQDKEYKSDFDKMFEEIKRIKGK